MLWSKIGLFVVVALTSVVTVLGKGHLWIRFIRFDNPGGKGNNGHCCDGRAFFCPSKCDHRFVICVDQRYGRRDTSSCPYGKKSTGEISNQDSIVFGSNIGGLNNPMIFDFDSWPGQVRVKIGVWDADDSNSDDLVDFLKQDITTRPARSYAKAMSQRFEVRKRVSLRMDVRVYCGPGSYGRTCAVTCVPRNDSSAGFNCDAVTGRKICLEGWTGQQCDVSVDDCVTNRCRHGASCVDSHRNYTCVCTPGYTGEFCEEDINECVSDPCLHNGTCTDDVNKFTCTCDPKWIGVTCHVRDACIEVMCSNGGTCFNINNTFVCKCPQGFTGKICEINVDECMSAPCQNDGTCTDLHGEFHCTCSPGWQSLVCDTDVDECASNPCVNASECHNLQNDFACVCDSGYTGKRCDTDINECLKEPCENGGTCVNQEPGFQCVCPIGFFGDTCETDVNECVTNPCSEGSSCVNVPGSFSCLCKPDFTGPTCDYQIDDCQEQLCEHNGTCFDLVNDFQCICTPRYTGRKCGVYIDRCLATPCQHGAQCRDPGYDEVLQCRCTPEWTGELCDQDVDECLLDPCANGSECVNTPGSFTCKCPEGWTGLLCQEDVNECQLLMDKEKEQRCEEDVDECSGGPCAKTATCINTPGSFHCVCPNGWKGDNCDQDIDECSEDTEPPVSCSGSDTNCSQSVDINSHCNDDPSCVTRFPPPCKNNATCLNTPGNFSCSCASGWTGRTCEADIDECVFGVGGVSSERVLSMTTESPLGGPGSEHSDLHSPAYVVQDGSRSADGFSNKAEDRRDRACFNEATCQNGAGSFSCSCMSGWSGLRCEQDINECSSEGSNPCKNQAQCNNLPGGFNCTCVGPWEGEVCSEEKDECRDIPCQNNGTCIRRSAVEGGGVQCVCRRGWQGRTCQEDRDECDLDPCLNGGTCINERGGFRCDCPENVVGLTCSNSTTFDQGVTLPLYLQGHLGPEEESKIKKGIKVFLQQNGGFRHDVSVRVYLQTHEMALGDTKMPVTQVSITVIVENVTLAMEDVTEIFNRIPFHELERYFPSPLFREEVEDHGSIDHTQQQKAGISVPWEYIVGGVVTMIVVMLIVVFICRKKSTVRWWPRKRSDTTVMFSQNGGNHSAPFDDTTVVFSQNGGTQNATFDDVDHGAEYVNALPYTQTSTMPRDNINPLPEQNDVNNTVNSVSPTPNNNATTLTRAEAAVALRRAQASSSKERPRSEAGVSRAKTKEQGSTEVRLRPKTEIVWSRPKEILLRQNSSSGSISRVSCGNADRREARASSRNEARSSCGAASLAMPSTGEDESRCYINTVYMTIPADAESEDTARNHQGHDLPPDPNRGALPPLPVMAAEGGVLPSSDVVND
ncbi:neurogenic locus notch homolog protein 1-like isoform X2 [Littorina saxatilis]|uniref:neurogenic locus notch homolog protein 1-like isoform X2 n=1 Tax=Littorina saxatilis TaxID=31220 RepID=UPI0038B4DA4E